jgi:hypothetical protein
LSISAESFNNFECSFHLLRIIFNGSEYLKWDGLDHKDIIHRTGHKHLFPAVIRADHLSPTERSISPKSMHHTHLPNSSIE